MLHTYKSWRILASSLLVMGLASFSTAADHLVWSLGPTNTNTQDGNLNAGIQMHGTAVVTVGPKKFLYVVGGNVYGGNIDSSFDSKSVYYSEITSTGTMAASWTTTTLVLPIIPGGSISGGAATDQANYAYIDNAVDSYNGRLYVAGGNTQSANPERNQVAWMSPTASGDITSITQVTASGLTIGQIFKAMCIDKVNGRMYIISADASRSGNAYVANIDAGTGAVGAFTLAGTFPTGVRQMPAVVAGGRLYLVGGNAAAAASSNAVQVADINAGTGALVNPRAITSLPVGSNDGTAVALNGAIYFMGGTSANTNATSLNTVWKGTINSSNGDVTWGADTSMPNTFVTTGRRRGGSATDGIAIFLPGGRDNGVLTAKTAIGVPTVNSAGVHDWQLFN